MIKIEGKPVLENDLECLRDQGFTDNILTVISRNQRDRHAHSVNAVAFAQSGMAIPALGTTHAD